MKNDFQKILFKEEEEEKVAVMREISDWQWKDVDERLLQRMREILNCEYER